MDAVSNFDKAFQTFQLKSKLVPDWVSAMRTASKDEFLKNGLPTLRDEDWKYTSLRSVKETVFEWDSSNLEAVPAFAKRLFVQDACNLVFLDGTLVPGQELVEHAHITSLEDAFAGKHSDKAQKALQLSSSVFQNAMTQLNGSFLAEGSFIYIPAKTKINKTIHILNLVSNKTAANASFPRHLIYLEAHAQASFIESIVSLSEESSEKVFTNSVSDFVLEESAQVSYAKFQRKNTSHFYFGHTRFFQKKESQAFSFFDIGQSALSREGISVKLAEERAESRIRGIFHTREREHVDYSVYVDHAASYTKSRQLFKGVAEDQSRGVFNAHIRVREGLRKIDAHQLTKNLLLGADAEIDAKPHLEIDSDDVKCAHGAAVGRMRTDEVFYLQARGMTRPKAEKMLSTAFTQEVVLSIKDEQFQNEILRHEANLSTALEMSISKEKGTKL